MLALLSEQFWCNSFRTPHMLWRLFTGASRFRLSYIWKKLDVEATITAMIGILRETLGYAMGLHGATYPIVCMVVHVRTSQHFAVAGTSRVSLRRAQCEAYA